MGMTGHRPHPADPPDDPARPAFTDDSLRLCRISPLAALLATVVYGIPHGQLAGLQSEGNTGGNFTYWFLTVGDHAGIAFILSAACLAALAALAVSTRWFSRGPVWTHYASLTAAGAAALTVTPLVLIAAAWVAFIGLFVALVIVIFVVVDALTS